MLRARTRTEKDVFSKTERLKQALETADAVLIGAGAGLSASAGFTYSGERFHRYFSDFEAKYGFHDMYSGGFYAYPTPEEHWAYWSRYIQVNRYEDAPRPVYDSLYRLISEKDYFVLTTNVDHCFQKAGFDKKRLFYTQGDYGLLQCCEPCHRQTYDNRALILRMVEEQKNMRIPTALIPRCPKCGKPMAVNLRSDDRFAEDEGWRKAAGRYADFLHRHDGMHILLWEIGVGYNTPGIIKYPFWQMTAQNPNAVYACLNSGQAVCPGAIQRQSICIDGDAGMLLQALLAPEESYE
ncbi:Sir2 silent information regulator family NAD-dependent deacetylase [Ruthenibacterium lactatiformans]|uniref:Sir2 silent information regulator family NAD-dependent deacetylase n=1 Tax=Ruthenibacterium lactatiformans TaxID=1550024 RepID=A0A0D8J5L4_9FIRM|nr:Sir2 silent information regulator family NAD-dependent deacetylase [Ruthenibacterium lactatiformans]KJF41108.1 Sir2 silent information regulator family NAD-dependent deacetylase [Ruthenibacterium lactatiformans]MBN3025261.1 Sir2 silent information regulator family NAD-dependent deacetylase [Ruthenibacterium lactatiformans]MCQ5087324.1 Sir2 silent information regulator family NAD-dependent deacetylase [Ruthenibacterium lactatiformans]